jgi:hypothetical protein
VWAKMKWLRIGVPFFLLLAWFTPRAQANITVLLEEPYSYDGALAGTGHTAVYLTRVCAATPIILRRCDPGEHGVVLSRYARIAGYDWIAIPLVPYLYAVENPDDVPLYADPKLVAFLRDQYRQAHLEDLAPDAPGGESPKGDWYELIGSSYDRTNYGYEIETTPEQDDALIEWLNSRPNRTSYKVVSHNCADFVREILDFYYPHSESHGSIADLGVSTPKHAAKSLVRYSRRHPDLEFTSYVIPQVPGSVKRSRPVRGVLESLLRAKKYVVVLAAFHPLIGGAAVSIDIVGDRFSPAKNSPLFNLSGEPLPPPTRVEKRNYLAALRAATANETNTGAEPRESHWRKFIEKARPGLDADGRAILQVTDIDGVVELGVTRRNVQTEDAPVELQRELLLSRLKQTLMTSRAPRISGSELRKDWELLENFDRGGREIFTGEFDSEKQQASRGPAPN